MVAVGLVRAHRARKELCASRSPYVKDSTLFSSCPLPSHHPLAADSPRSILHDIAELYSAHLIPPTTLAGKYCDTYFKDKETEAKRD